MQNPKILIVVSNNSKLYDPRACKDHPTGTWLSEYGWFYKQAKYDMRAQFIIASPQGGIGPIDPASMDLTQDPADKDLIAIKDEIVQSLMQTTSLDNVYPSQFNAIMIPGGHGLLGDLVNNEALSEILSAFKGYVASVCHGPAALIGARNADGTPYVQGKSLTCFSKKEEMAVGLDAMVAHAIGVQLEDRLRDLGANYQSSQDNFKEFTLHPLPLITGQNPQSARMVAVQLDAALALTD